MPLILRYGDHLISLQDGREVHLSQSESDLLAVLAKHGGRVVSYQTIEQTLWPLDADRPRDPRNVIHVHVLHLRAKLRGTGLAIEAAPGLGERLKGDLSVDWTVR